jgi:hypothetical protein
MFHRRHWLKDRLGEVEVNNIDNLTMEVKMNYARALVALVVGCFVLLSATFQVASAAEQTVKFVVPGCV